MAALEIFTSSQEVLGERQALHPTAGSIPSGQREFEVKLEGRR